MENIPNDGLCDCSCASPCPLGKTGSEGRCSITQLAAFFKCLPGQALEELHDWWPMGSAEIDRLYKEYIKDVKS